MTNKVRKLQSALDCFEIEISSDMIFLSVMGEPIAAYSIDSTSGAQALQEARAIMDAALGDR